MLLTPFTRIPWGPAPHGLAPARRGPARAPARPHPLPLPIGGNRHLLTPGCPRTTLGRLAGAWPLAIALQARRARPIGAPAGRPGRGARGPPGRDRDRLQATANFLHCRPAPRSQDYYPSPPHRARSQLPIGGGGDCPRRCGAQRMASADHSPRGCQARRIGCRWPAVSPGRFLRLLAPAPSQGTTPLGPLAPASARRPLPGPRGGARPIA